MAIKNDPAVVFGEEFFLETARVAEETIDRISRYTQ